MHDSPTKEGFRPPPPPDRSRHFFLYAVARSLEMGIPPAVQFTVALLAGAEEGGRFFPLMAVAMILFAMADLGVSRALPALAGNRSEDGSPRLPEILGWRWLAGMLTAAGILLLPVSLLRPWGIESGVQWPLILFLAGRLQLTACQGFRLGRADFRALARGGIGQAAVLCLCLAGVWSAGALNAVNALTATGLSAWAGVWLLHDSRIWPKQSRSLLFLPFSSAGRVAARQVFPLAWASVSGSLYPRLDALIGGWFLSHATLGTYALLDAAYRLLLAPGGMAAQTVFPDLRAAADRHSPGELQAALGWYFRAGGQLGAVVVFLGGLAVWHLSRIDPIAVLPALAFAFSLPLSIPNAILPPLWLSMGWLDEWAVYAGLVTFLRLAAGAPACALWGSAGLAWTHFALEASACVGFWLIWRHRRKQLWAASSPAGPV
ncbi:hypothetical protein KBA41_13075 [Candidatus Ozemobacteraceae bacterium]|nr:hypothetical protein [Candidatus Ozemobacteraceae bacterium]